MHSAETAKKITGFIEFFTHIHLHQIGDVSDPKLLRKKGQVTWFGRKDGWIRPFWFELYQYQGEFIRLVNKREFPISKSRWPFPPPSCGGVRPLKLTFHVSEIKESLSELSFKMMTEENWWFESDSFDETQKVPTSAWSIIAKENRAKLE